MSEGIRSGHGERWQAVDWRERLWVQATLANPLARREWLALRRHAGDWRLWLGMRWSLDPVAWGVPVVLGATLPPYALAALTGMIRRLWPGLNAPDPADVFGLLLLMLWVHVPLISLVLAATAVTRERERQTWEQLCLTRLTGSERACGYLLGRLAPVWGSLIVSSGFWWLLYPCAASWLSPYQPLVVYRADIVAGGAVSCILAIAAGLTGLFASACAKNSRVAITLAVLRLCQTGLLLGAAGPILVLLDVLFGRPFPPVAGLGTVAVGLWYGWRWPGRWSALEEALTQP
jgi:hypothetical protein